MLREELRRRIELIRQAEPVTCPGLAAAIVRAGVVDFDLALKMFVAGAEAADRADVVAAFCTGAENPAAAAERAALAELPPGFQPDEDAKDLFQPRSLAELTTDDFVGAFRNG